MADEQRAEQPSTSKVKEGKDPMSKQQDERASQCQGSVEHQLDGDNDE